MKKVLVSILCMVMLVPMLQLTACSGKTPAVAESGTGNAESTAAENNDPFYRYPEKVTLTSAMPITTSAKKLPSMDTLEDNGYTRYLEQESNINVKITFEAEAGDAFRQRVRLSVASDDIPDFMVVDEYSILRQMADYEMLADIRPYYDQYASPFVKELYNSSEGRGLKDCEFNGSLAALPQLNTDANSITMLWIRQDWLDKLGLEQPRIADDIITVGKAFVENDPDGNGKADTFALMGDKDLVDSFGKVSLNSFDSIFSSYHSFPKLWLKDSNGKVYYGSVAKETKLALAKLQEMYKTGVIDKEFALRKDVKAPIVTGKTGMVFGPWYSPMNPLGYTLQNDTKAEWKPVLAPLDSEGKFTCRMMAPNNNYLVISKKCQNIDAVIRYYNFVVRYTYRMEPTAERIYANKPELAQIYQLNPITICLAPSDAVEQKYALYNNIVNGKASLEGQDVETQTNVGRVKKEMAEPKKDLPAWATFVSYMVAGKLAYQNPVINKVNGCFYGITPTQESKGATLDSLENEAFLKIIMGNEPIDYFDTFVEEWNKLGGQIMAAEIQRQVDSSK